MEDGYWKLTTDEYYKSGMGVGEMWDEIGRLQFGFLVREGLEPHHKLLDIGCGSLRGGIHFINYLNEGNYYGFDKSAFLITAAYEIEIPNRGLGSKKPNLYIRDDFHFKVAGEEFDYLLAQSVFTHLTWNSILRCLCKTNLVMHAGSKFYATFFENPSGDPKAPQIRQKCGFTYMDSDPFHYDIANFEDLANRSGLQVKYIGDWAHPRDQKMLLFTKNLSVNSSGM